MQHSREVYSFEFDGPWEEYLDANGFCVIRQVAPQEQVEKAIDEYWTCFESLYPGLSRNSLESWKQWRVDQRGIVLVGEILQSQAAWRIRGLPRVKGAFSRIWKDDDLIASMDSTLMWRPWWEHKGWTPRTEGLHLDQVCSQAPLSLIDFSEVLTFSQSLLCVLALHWKCFLHSFPFYSHSCRIPSASRKNAAFKECCHY
jgi:hypothetical protein